MTDILKKITDYKKIEVIKLKKKQSIKNFEKEIVNSEKPRKFLENLNNPNKFTKLVGSLELKSSQIQIKFE